MHTVENCKLVICDVREGSLISQHEPSIPGVEWVEIPESRETVGSFYQCLKAGRVPESQIDSLPEYCSVDDRFVHVAKLNVNWQNGREVLEVCHHQGEGLRIESSIY